VTETDENGRRGAADGRGDLERSPHTREVEGARGARQQPEVSAGGGDDSDAWVGGCSSGMVGDVGVGEAGTIAN
jgi:hypothetical protein